jgi:hypothetical protein
VEDLSHDESSEKPDTDSISEKDGAQSIIMEEEVDQVGSETGRKRKQEDRTPSSQFLKEDSKRVRDSEVEDEEVRHEAFCGSPRTFRSLQLFRFPIAACLRCTIG